MRHRAFGRVWGVLAPIFLGLLAAAACSNDDLSRNAPTRGTLGEELFGAACDRVGAQSLHEDLTGESYQNICHRVNGAFSSTVNVAALPTQFAGPPAFPSAGDDPAADRARAIARIERLAADRDGPLGLIAALDATFPDMSISIKDINNPDEDQSCNSAGQGSLHTELSNLLTRFTALYDDGTMPQATEALSSVVSAFLGSASAPQAYAHFDARAGYRPVDLAVGVGRSVLSYPKLRDLTNAMMKLLSPDSNPYDPNPPKDSNGLRIPVAGSAYPQLSQLLSVAHAELMSDTPDPTPSPLVLAETSDPALHRTVLNRPRTDLEVVKSVLFAEDPSFAGGPFGTMPPLDLVRRDPRGYAAVPTAAGALPTPFTAGPDGLPALDSLGRFITNGASPAPPPLRNVEVPDPPGLSRDSAGRALSASGTLTYDYVDARRTYLSALFGHFRGAVSGKSLVDSNPADNHETLMGSLAGAYVLFGPRSPSAMRTYASGAVVTYNGFLPAPSPLGDLVYALGQMLADPTTDPTLSLASTLVSNNPNDVARVVGAALWSKDQANADGAAKIPPASTLWDEMIDVLVQIAQDTSVAPAGGSGGHRLLEDVLYAFADPASQGLAKAFASQAAFVDDISYDRSNLNGPVVNVTTHGTDPPKTPADRTKLDASANRSELQRFAQLVHDTDGVTMCNKEGAVLHAAGLPIFNTANACASTAGNAGELCTGPSSGCTCNNARPFHECEVFKIDNLAKFYLDSIAGTASLYFRNKLVREGIGTGPGGTGATSVGVVEQSSGIGWDTAQADKYNDTPTSKTGPAAPGFWDPASTVWNPTLSPPTTLRPKPGWIHRQIHFDVVNDSPMPPVAPATNNYTTNHFLADLQGLDVGTSVCPERVIPDPCQGNANCGPAADAAVAPDGSVHGLRSCADGDWLYQRDNDTLFTLEENNFLDAIAPLAKAFASHGREDLFIQILETLHKHWQTANGAAAAPSECKLSTDASGKIATCSKDGADTYEPLLTKIFSSDLLASISHLTSVAQGISIPTCSAVDPQKHTCTMPGPTLDGVGVLAASARALIDPNVAKAFKLTDSAGNVTSLRNDMTTNAQVTPLYLMLEALNEVDAAFAQDARATPADPDLGRQSEWRLARSQIVDELLSVKNEVAANTAPPGADGGAAATETFADPSFSKITPVLIDTIRAQLLARCGSDETTGRCLWARGSVAAAKAGTPVTALWNDLVTTASGPTFAARLDLLDALRRDPGARAAQEDLLSYLLDPAATDAVGNVESLSELLTTSLDALQVIPDDTNLVPFSPVLAAAVTAPPAYPQDRSAVDATTALLSRIAGRAYDAQGREDCNSELDPNGVLDIALANLVKPMKDPNGNPTLTPLEVIANTIADVNRTSPSSTSSLASGDYGDISDQITQFLTDPQRGIEQLYAIVRQGSQ